MDLINFGHCCIVDKEDMSRRGHVFRSGYNPENGRG